MTLKEQYKEFENKHIEEIKQNFIKQHGEIEQFEYRDGFARIVGKNIIKTLHGENPKIAFCKKHNCSYKDLE